MSAELQIVERLTQQLRDGHDAALGELIEHFRDRLLRIIRFRIDHRIAARISAADVLQEAFISAGKRLDHFRDRQPAIPVFVWLRLIVNQQLINLHREHLHAEMRDARKEISIDQQQPSAQTSLAIAVQLVGRATSPSGAFSRAERISTIEQALNGMESIDREVIALRHFEELTNNEVAEVLGIDVQAASKRYVRAMKRMKAVLGNAVGNDEP